MNILVQYLLCWGSRPIVVIKRQYVGISDPVILMYVIEIRFLEDALPWNAKVFKLLEYLIQK
jgi:hypothetical protein